MTILEAIQKSSEFLEKKGVDSPRLNAELLLAHLLGINRLKLYLDHAALISPETTERYRELIRRRGQREPLQHLLGSAEFCGLEIKVSPAALIPRPETELLAEQGWLFLNSLPTIPAPSFLDLGTGSGCIALALAKHSPASLGLALDISAEALSLAQENARRLQLDTRVSFRISDRFSSLTPVDQFNLIISNPPYIPAGEIPTLQPEVRQYDPHLALVGGQDGLDFYRFLAANSASYLRPAGKLMVEIGDGQESALLSCFLGHNWIVEKFLPDYSGRARIMIAHK